MKVRDRNVDSGWLGTKLMQIVKETILQVTKTIAVSIILFPHKVNTRYYTGGLVRSEKEARILYTVAKEKLYFAV